MEWPEITKDTPIEEVKRIHQKIWDYTIKHGRKPETPYPASCAACAYSRMMNENVVVMCDCCPIVWPDNKQCSMWNGLGLYDQYLDALICKHPITDKIKIRMIALRIRNLPWKFEKGE